MNTRLPSTIRAWVPRARAGSIACLVCLIACGAQAQILYQNGLGTTVYGVTGYGLPANAVPVFIPNNVTLRNDVLASPGGGFLTANPVVANNIAQTPVNVALPLSSFQVGGGNINGPFGAAANVITGPNIGFSIADFSLGGGSASYTISSWRANFTVGANGFNGALTPMLSVGGKLVGGAGGSADAVSLVTSYSINGNAAVVLPPLVLAAAGNGNGNAVGQVSALAFGPGHNSFAGFAFDVAPVALAAGDTISAVTTLTAIADPASIDSFTISDLLSSGLFAPDALTPLQALEQNLNSGASFAFASTLQTAPHVPDSTTTSLLLALAIGGIAAIRRFGRTWFRQA